MIGSTTFNFYKSATTITTQLASTITTMQQLQSTTTTTIYIPNFKKIASNEADLTEAPPSATLLMTTPHPLVDQRPLAHQHAHTRPWVRHLPSHSIDAETLPAVT